MDDYSDLSELGIDLKQEDALSIKFNNCAKHIQSIADTLDNDNLLKLYGLYKQSLEGPCKTPKPSWYDIKGKAKWEAWHSLGNMDQHEAKNKYIDLVLILSPKFCFDDEENKAGSWTKVSTFAQEPGPIDRSICDYIRSGNITNVTAYLNVNSKNKNTLDSSGMGLIHYTSDIGNVNILQILVNEGCDINLQDSEGQTALHYAVSCGHLDCVKFLLDSGARRDLKDSEGCLPVDVACENAIRTLLQ